MKGYLIDAANRRIEPLEYEYKTMREHLPGGICVAQVFPNGDVLYVDDEALLRPATVAFRIKCRPDGQPMMSNGILTGRDTLESTAPPRFTPEQLLAEIEWLDLDVALDWFRERANTPAVTFTAFDQGQAHREVIANWSAMLANLEGREGGYKP